jgi:hypothetical protein
MGTSQAFRVALHIPVLDPSAAQVVSTSSGGDMYTSAWVTTSGINEAPIDGQQYGRTSSAWTVITPNPTWSTLSGKPSTFPPTVPIPWTDVSGKPATFPPTTPIPWTDLSGVPASFPPTLPIAQSGVTNLVSDLAAKAPIASPTFTGDAKAVTTAATDSDTSIATTAFTQAAITLAAGNLVIDCGTF